MLIAKTTVNKNGLIALQQQLFDETRTHENDLIALCYAFDPTVVSNDVLCDPTPLDEYLDYTFMWVIKLGDLPLYQYPSVRIRAHKFTRDDNDPQYVILATANLATWVSYVQSGGPTRFCKMIKDQLERDGYTRRFL